MKKVAILTLYYHNYNYGGMLQSYALQKAIEEMGYISEQISYRLYSGYRDTKHVKLQIRNCVLYLYYLIKDNKWIKNYNTVRRKINEFANSIPHTRVVTASNISQIVKYYDVFICGSDQIWNPVGWQPTLFLDFVPKNKTKISYAASIARENLSESQFEFIRRNVKDFSAISVREKNSADMLNHKYQNLNVRHMPDPVFLLEKSAWEKIVQRKENSEPFIFAYFLGESNKNREKAVRFAEENGMKIYFVSYLDYSQFTWDEEHSEYVIPPLGVIDFLNNIANASLVLTDSFHAAAFSAILRTPFYAMPRFNNSDKASMNSRIYNLMEELNLPNRYTNVLKSPYAWNRDELSNIESNLNRLRQKGVKYINDNLK